MTRPPFPAPLFLASLLCACGTDMPAGNTSIDLDRAAREAQGSVNAYSANLAAEQARGGTRAPRPAATPTFAPLTPPAPGTPGGLPDDRTPISEAPFTPDSAQGAADVVQTYYALLGEGKYDRARALWQPGAGGAGSSPAVFAAGFARYTEYRAQVGAPGRIDAGAGQRYVSVPVQIAARLKTGEAVYEIGSAVLHRTGDIDGATADQRRWRLQRIETAPAPKAAASSDAAATPSATRYRCIDGSRIVVSIDPTRNTATVRSGAKVETVLHGERADATMPTYRSGGFSWHGDGEQATYTRPGAPPLACRTR